MVYRQNHNCIANHTLKKYITGLYLYSDNVAMLEFAAFLLQLEVRSWNYKVIYF